MKRTIKFVQVVVKGDDLVALDSDGYIWIEMGNGWERLSNPEVEIPDNLNLPIMPYGMG